MIFLVSTVFVVLCYVLPGYWVLDLAATRWLPLPLPVSVRFWGLAFIVYSGLVAAVGFGRWAYDDLQGDRSGAKIKTFLDAQGCRWLTVAGLLFLGGQAAYMTLHWAVPYQFMPLYGALCLGFFDLRGRPRVRLPSDALPEPVFSIEEDSLVHEGDLVSELSWDFVAKGNSQESNRFTYVLPIRPDNVERAKRASEVKPVCPDDYLRFVTGGPIEEVRELAGWLRKQSQDRHFDGMQEVECVIRLVRSIRYRSDPVLPCGGDDPQFPVITLAEQAGDCEDHAILAAALLWQLGHSVGLFFVRLEEGSHMALAYRTEAFRGSYSMEGPDGESYTYIETTPSDTGLGEIPADMLLNFRRALIIPVR
jgi:predicted transglutaminase-like cysteine proteinase